MALSAHHAYVQAMKAPSTVLPFLIACAVALTAFDAAAAPRKKRAVQNPAASTVPPHDGTPVIMRDERWPRRVPDMMKEEPGTRPRVERPARSRRGSSTYVPPPVPSLGSPNSPPSAVLLRPAPQPPQPPPIRSFGDRVINCIHSAPFNAGVGNNPADSQAYIRHCAN